MKIDRLVSIIMILLEKKRIGAQELADKFEVSPRTIYRDIDVINMAGIPVCSISGVGGGFEILQNYKLDKKVFSSSDLSAILMGLSSLSGMIRGQELVNALAKVRSFIPADWAKDIELKANQVLIDLSPWTGDRNVGSCLEIIKSALQDNRMLSFDYLDRNGNRIARKAEPCRLVLKGSHWYWQGYCRQKKDFRLFKFSRTSDLKIIDEFFSPRDYQKPQLDFSDILAEGQTKVKIRIHKSVMERVLDYCPKESFLPDGEDHWIVDFPFIENEYYYDILLSLGPKCECLEPSRIRHGMKKRIRDLAAVYGC